ncbi:MAG TPA: MraY family glycosyltransferase [Aggregatilineaceae bacterium]|nr:MraY family glycosyltransferase [Aggregatilineaceae bacterium]
MELVLGLLLTLMVTPVLIWAASNFGLLDHPDERKQHQEAVPLVGGLAMAFAIAVSAAWHLANADMFWGLFVAVSIIVVVGFLDDWIELSVRVRFLSQGIAALIMALFAGAQLISLGDLFGLGTIALGLFAVPFTIFAVVGMANALNMSDGLDGLAGGLALISASFVAAAAYVSGHEITLEALLILGGALIGFLFYNMRFPWQRRAKVFMGDSGSLMLGFLLAWAVISVTQGDGQTLSPAAALWFFAIPLWDTVSLMLRRMLKGRSPCHPGRDHLHHILLRVGYTDGQVVRFIHLVAVLCGLIGFFGWQAGVPDAVMFYSFLAIFALYCVGVQHAWKLMRLIVPLRQPQE